MRNKQHAICVHCGSPECTCFDTDEEYEQERLKAALRRQTAYADVAVEVDDARRKHIAMLERRIKELEAENAKLVKENQTLTAMLTSDQT